MVLTPDRCRGCGRRGKQPYFQAVPQGRNRMGDVNRLCERCRRVVEQLRRDTRVTAVFIFSLGKKTKYYAMLRGVEEPGLVKPPPVFGVAYEF